MVPNVMYGLGNCLDHWTQEIVEAQAKGEAYVPPGASQLSKVRAMWAQLPNAGSAGIIPAGGKSSGANHFLTNALQHYNNNSR